MHKKVRNIEPPDPTRRRFLRAAGAAPVAALMGGCATQWELQNYPTAFPSNAPPHDSAWLKSLSKPFPQERMDYEPVVEGKLPEGLDGILYRNGPGLFERNGVRRNGLLDGDGTVREFQIHDGKVRFRTAPVMTAKYIEEQRAGEFLNPTWVTLPPGGCRKIPCVPDKSQANISILPYRGQLLTFDEVGRPYALNPETLETEGAVNPIIGDPSTNDVNIKAHTKTCGETGNLIMVGESGHANPDLHIMTNNADGKLLAHIVLPKPRKTAYFHDFFLAGKYAVFHLSPMELPTIPVSMLLGMKTWKDSLEWKPEKGGLLLVVDTTGKDKPITIEVPACFMWHTVNAHTDGKTIVADFVGYDAPDHFLGKDAALTTVMDGREGVANSSGTLRRFTIDLAAKKAKLETVADGRFEFPMVAPSRVGQNYQYGYMTSNSEKKGILNDGIARVDMQTGEQTAFHFGSKHYVGEPPYVPNPVFPRDDEKNGWLLPEVLDGHTGKSFLAVFEAANLEKGPVAKVHLSHAMPASFHGAWQSALDRRAAANQRTTVAISR